MAMSLFPYSFVLAIFIISDACAYVPPTKSLSIPPSLHYATSSGSITSSFPFRRCLLGTKSGTSFTPRSNANAAPATSTFAPLYLSPNDDNNDNENTYDSNETEVTTKSETKLTEKNPIGQALEFAFNFSSYSIQFLGVAFSLGLLLNICGYGYTFDLERGLHIDKMENIRTELQFRREIQRSNNK